MPFKGRLAAGELYTLIVNAGSSNGEGTAATVAYINNRDRFTVVDTLTVPPGTQGRRDDTPTLAWVRLIIQVNPPTNGTAVVRVTQTGAFYEDTIAEDTVFVYDIGAR